MIIAFDPSGNFHEGKGVTGYVVLHNTGEIMAFGEIDASTYDSQEAYWAAHLKIITDVIWLDKKAVVVCEDYMLYANRAASQINSRLETPKLIGVLQYFCWSNGLQFVLQTAVSVKRRWTNHILSKKGYIKAKTYKKGETSYDICYIKDEKVMDHILDALRHAVHYATFHSSKDI
jgi:hypothetical protein